MQKKINIRYSSNKDFYQLEQIKNKFSLSTNSKILKFLLFNFKKNNDEIINLQNENFTLKIRLENELKKNNCTNF